MLRGAALTILLLLLFNPLLPTTARTSKPLGTVVVLDASLSMEMPAGNSTRWAEAVARAKSVSGVDRIILMGGVPRMIPRDSLDAVKPQFGVSRLLPALQAAAEGGADRVVLITDGGIEDAQEVRRWLPRLGVQLETQMLGSSNVADRAITELAAPAWAEAGKPITVQVGVAVTGGDNAVRVNVRQGSTAVGNTSVAAPGAGRINTGTIAFTPATPEGGGLVRYDVEIEGTDAVAGNNRRSFYVLVGEKPAGVALISIVPDWEPRFLHPVIAQSLGLPVRSFLRANGATWVTGGPATEAGKRITEDQVRAAIADADLFVVHGAGADLPGWVRDALTSKPRVLLLPHESGLDIGSISLSPATPGDWFIAQDVPSSPVAGVLAALPVENLAPLLGVNLAREIPSGGWVPLMATRGRRGAQTPVAIGMTQNGRRTVVALGQGFWRWAFRGGEQRQVYARFWGALAGWLIQEQTQMAGGAVRPVARVVERGQPLAWVAPAIAADSVRLRISNSSGITADTTIPMQQADTALSSTLPPDHYRYEAVVYSEGREAGRGSGPLTVDAYSSEFSRITQNLNDLTSVAQAGIGAGSRAGSMPLRTSFWPYLLLVLLLATEWILRRRWGLR